MHAPPRRKRAHFVLRRIASHPRVAGEQSFYVDFYLDVSWTDPRIARFLESGEDEPDYENDVWSPAVELTNSVESSHEDDFYTYDKESQRMNISSKYRAKLSTLPRMESLCLITWSRAPPS